MKISEFLTDDGIIRELGARLTAARLERNLTQADLAAEAGVSKRSVERLESGEVAAQLSGFIRVCRVLGLLDRMDALVPETRISPMAQLKLRGQQRKRAASPQKRVMENTKKWTWGES
ncbi:MAG: helix-turn-helix domain-containing protein [Gemmatimonas sp.]